jgi:hypothetical protein
MADEPRPQVSDNAFVEREGVIAVEAATNSARCVWRETVQRDVGVDGQIEYVDPDGKASGRIVAVQVKSGTSRFVGASDSYVDYTPPERHRNYWREFPLPVVLVLFNPDHRTAYWADARAQLRAGATTVRVPLDQRLDAAGVLAALQADGPLPDRAMPPSEIARLMLLSEETESGGGVTFLDLFIQGLTDRPGWSVYFNMDLYGSVVEAQLALANPEARGWGMGDRTYEFIDRYVSFLIAYDLARVDYDSFHRSALQYHTVGVILAPLTERGRAVVNYVEALDEANEGYNERWPAVRERPVLLLLEPRDVYERAMRLDSAKEAIASGLDESR